MSDETHLNPSAWGLPWRYADETHPLGPDGECEEYACIYATKLDDEAGPILSIPIGGLHDAEHEMLEFIVHRVNQTTLAEATIEELRAELARREAEL